MLNSIRKKCLRLAAHLLALATPSTLTTAGFVTRELALGESAIGELTPEEQECVDSLPGFVAGRSDDTERYDFCRVTLLSLFYRRGIPGYVYGPHDCGFWGELAIPDAKFVGTSYDVEERGGSCNCFRGTN